MAASVIVLFGAGEDSVMDGDVAGRIPGGIAELGLGVVTTGAGFEAGAAPGLLESGVMVVGGWLGDGLVRLGGVEEPEMPVSGTSLPEAGAAARVEGDGDGDALGKDDGIVVGFEGLMAGFAVVVTAGLATAGLPVDGAEPVSIGLGEGCDASVSGGVVGVTAGRLGAGLVAGGFVRPAVGLVPLGFGRGLAGRFALGLVRGLVAVLVGAAGLAGCPLASAGVSELVSEIGACFSPRNMK